MKTFKKTLFSLLIIILGLVLISCGEKENTYVNRMQVQSEAQLISLLGDNNPIRHKTTYDMTIEKAFNIAPNAETTNREYIETNIQVENVDEADVIKTDGNFIYYRNSNNGGLYCFEVLNDGTINLRKSIVEDNHYIQQLYINDDYIITIGSINDFVSKSSFNLFRFYFYNKGFVKVYSKESLELAYQLVIDNSFSFHRLIDDKLFLIHNHYIYGDKLIPSFTETLNGQERTHDLDYKDVYYFNKDKSYSLSVYNVLNLNSFNLSSEAYIGNVENIYMNENNLYSTSTSYDYKNNTTATEIIKFSINNKKEGFKYLAKGKVDGYILDSYSLDEHNNYLRVVSTSWNPVKNYLTVLKQNPTEDSLDVVGLLTDGLGKVGETVKSVRFLEDKAYVVTFRQTDPLYTIDLTDPTTPLIINAIEEPGYSAYLHSWDNGHIIGLGLNATPEGVVNGLKLSAYKDDSDEPLQTFIFSQETSFSWNYSEAIYNPKAILISPKIGIIAFPLSSSGYTIDYQYVYNSQYVIFKIDFSDYNNIISKPLTINHPSDNGYVYVERGIYIKDTNFEYIFTFSNLMVISYDLANDEIVQELPLK